MQLAQPGPRPPAVNLKRTGAQTANAASISEGIDLASTAMDIASISSWVDEPEFDPIETVEITKNLSRILQIEIHASNQTDTEVHGALRTAIYDEDYNRSKKGMVVFLTDGTLTLAPDTTDVWKHPINTQGFHGQYYIQFWMQDLESGETMDVNFSPKKYKLTFE